MPRYYCDYCDTHLTHDSPSVRKQHNAGYKHKANVREYYQQFEQLQTQSLIDQKIKEHIGHAGGMYQIGAVYNQHLAAGLPGIMQRPPRLPILQHPLLPIPGAPPSMMPGFRPPMLQRPGYGMGPPPQMAQIPGQPPMQANGMMLPRPPPPSTMNAAPPTEGGILPPPPGSSTSSSSSSSNAPPPGTNITQPPMYHLQPNGPPPPPASASTDSYAYASAPGAAH